jgi:hypothetical protein
MNPCGAATAGSYFIDRQPEPKLECTQTIHFPPLRRA